MARLFINKQELERVFGGDVELGKAGIFVQDGGSDKCLLGRWDLKTGNEAMGQPVVKKKKKKEGETKEETKTEASKE